MESELRSYAINSKEFIRGLQDSLELVILLVLLTVIISNHNVIFTMTSSQEESKPSCSSSIRHRKQRKHFDYIRSNSLFSLFDIPSSSLSSLWTFCYFRENGCLFFMRTLYISWVSETPPSSWWQTRWVGPLTKKLEKGQKMSWTSSKQWDGLMSLTSWFKILHYSFFSPSCHLHIASNSFLTCLDPSEDSASRTSIRKEWVGISEFYLLYMMIDCL